VSKSYSTQTLAASPCRAARVGKRSVVALTALFLGCLQAGEPPARFLAAGERALEYTRRVVELGPRPAGSDAQRRQQQLIIGELSKLDCEVREDNFVADTPIGQVEMKNITARFSGESDRVVVISGHYDTLLQTGGTFVGANDGGSSTGFLLEMASLLNGQPLKDSIWLVFFDGEEALVRWSGNDHTYGSRRMASLWELSGVGRKIKALINVDMIGDADLRLLNEGQSTDWLRSMAGNTGRRLGYVREFPVGEPQYIEDDHVEFIKRGMPAVDLIDLDYGLMNRYWHTPQDTMDKLSARSFGVVLHVVSEMITELGDRP